MAFRADEPQEGAFINSHLMLIGVMAPVFSERDAAAAEGFMSPHQTEALRMWLWPHPHPPCSNSFFHTALSSPKAALLSWSKSMFPPQSDVPPLNACPSRECVHTLIFPHPRPLPVFIILINQDHCTCLSILRVALPRKKEVIKVVGKACWGFGLEQRWKCNIDKMNRIQMPELSLNPLLLLSPCLSLLFNTWSPLCARSTAAGREIVNEAAAELFLIAWMNKWLLEDSVNTHVIEAQIIVSSKIPDIFQILNTFQTHPGL